MLVPDKKLTVSVKHNGETKDYVMTVAPAPRPVFERRMDVNQTEIQAERAARASAEAVRIGSTRIGGGGSPSAGAFSRLYFITPNGAFGAVLSTVGPELAKTLKLEPGVLVNDVTDETPASKGGLRTGDVITSVAGQSVASLKALQQIVAMRGGERSVVLDVVRDKRPQKVTVSW
jgi:membrane-associated protease RseP (regulator of RpoE activity)